MTIEKNSTTHCGPSYLKGSQTTSIYINNGRCFHKSLNFSGEIFLSSRFFNDLPLYFSMLNYFDPLLCPQHTTGVMIWTHFILNNMAWFKISSVSQDEQSMQVW